MLLSCKIKSRRHNAPIASGVQVLFGLHPRPSVTFPERTSSITLPTVFDTHSDLLPRSLDLWFHFAVLCDRLFCETIERSPSSSALQNLEDQLAREAHEPSRLGDPVEVLDDKLRTGLLQRRRPGVVSIGWIDFGAISRRPKSYRINNAFNRASTDTHLHPRAYAPVLVCQRKEPGGVLDFEPFDQNGLAGGLETLHAVHVRGRVQLDGLQIKGDRE